MKKFKTQKEILLTPEFKHLAFELLQAENYYIDDDILNKDEMIEMKIRLYIDRKLKQLKMQGI